MIPTAETVEHGFPAGSGELPDLIRRVDWSRTSLGPIERWPQSVRTTVAAILCSRVPIVTLWGDDGIMIYNDAYSAFAGGRHPQLLGSKVREGWPEVADFNDHVLKVVLAGGALTYKGQELTLYRNGRPEQVWMDLDYSPLPDESGTPIGVMAIVIETTARVAAERWREGEYERLRRMFEQAPGFVAMLQGPKHVFELVNPAYLQLVGPRELLGRSAGDALPELASQGFVELLDEAFASGRSARHSAMAVDLRRGADGRYERRYVDFVLQPLRDAAGAVSGVFIQGTDATARVLAEAVVRDAAARNRQVLDSAVDSAIVASALDGRVTNWNEGARRILGWSEAEMLGRDAACIFTPEDREAGVPLREVQRALADGHARAMRWHLRKSGERFWADAGLTPIRDDSGVAVGFVLVLRDHTEQHRVEQALRQLESGLRRAQEAGGVGTFSTDADFDLLYVTPEFCRIFGLAPTETVSARSIELLVLPEYRRMVSDSASRRAGDSPLEVEYRIRRADTGEERTIFRKAEFERDAEGRPLRMVGLVQDVTERRAEQRALEEREAQFRALAQSIPNQVWTALPDGSLDWVNERACTETGLPYDALLGSGALQLVVHPDDVSALVERWPASPHGGETFEHELRLRRADGSYHWYLSRAVPLRGHGGEIVRWIGTNTDINERKLADAANARDRERMWTMSQDLMLVFDRSATITAVNPSAARTLGWQQEELVGLRLFHFLHPDDFARSARQLSQLSRGEKILGLEARCRIRDGSYRLLQWTAVPDEDRVHAVGRDVTDERNVARMQERIWTLSPVLKLIGDATGRILRINPAWTNVLGWTAHDCENRLVIDFAAPDNRPLASECMRRAAAGEAIREQQLTFSASDGSHRQIIWSFVQDHGMLYGFGRDVTEQRAAEEALRQSQKMEAIGQLTGGIAHDFNNLLQGIIGSLELLSKRIAVGRLEDAGRFIGGALNSANRASALTHRLLAYARRQPLDPRPLQVNPLLASMDDLLRRTLGERIELHFVLAPDLWLTRCDANQLESAVINLAINARDAMPDGGRLVVETCNTRLDENYTALQRDVRPGEYICICVTDTGSGMSREVVERAFEPFFTTKPIGQGTGLGLSMIYGFARQSDGHARIYSELGQGTTVKLYLPRNRGDLSDAEELPGLTAPLLASRGATVLVIEDEAIVRDLVALTLRELGHVTLEAADGPAGLEILRSNRTIDLLVTDIGLPKLDGRQVADAARELRPRLKVLLMTGYADQGVLAAGPLAPGMELITKPFPVDAFAERVDRMLSGGAAG
jgi:PAS domain S-box-containing protein